MDTGANTIDAALESVEESDERGALSISGANAPIFSNRVPRTL